MSRCLLSLALLGFVAADRAFAFGGRGPIVGPPVWFAPAYFFPVYEIAPFLPCPVPCCPAPAPEASGSALPLPKVQQVAPTPPAPAPKPRDESAPPPTAPPKAGGLSGGPVYEKLPPLKDISPAGVAIPKAADPTAPTAPVYDLKAPKRTDDPLPPLTPPVDKIVSPKFDAPAIPITPKEPAESHKIPSPNVPTDPDGGRFPPLKLMPPTGGTSESRSSPISASRSEPRVEVLTVEGPTANNGQPRTVGFHNRTDRTVTLTVQGESVQLPGWHSVTARVPTSFTWKLDDGEERTTEVPAGSPGVEVMIRK